jgi:hypothetical protein
VRKVTDVPVVGHPLRLRVRVRATGVSMTVAIGKCSPTTPPSWPARAGRRHGGAPAISCAG